VCSSVCHHAAILDKERTKEVFEYIDAAIGKREPLEKVLKLLSLCCLTDDGLAPKQFDQYRRDIIQVKQRACGWVPAGVCVWAYVGSWARASGRVGSRARACPSLSRVPARRTVSSTSSHCVTLRR
jgi:hypothetical protein